MEHPKKDGWCPRCDHDAWSAWRWGDTEEWSHSREDVGKVVERTGPHGVFLGCSNFPECRWSAMTEVVKRRRDEIKRGRGKFINS
jgi:ssDNA-binding Zn-finger/Zn-ribbon topoisomerase 1